MILMGLKNLAQRKIVEEEARKKKQIPESEILKKTSEFFTKHHLWSLPEEERRQMASILEKVMTAEEGSPLKKAAEGAFKRRMSDIKIQREKEATRQEAEKSVTVKISQKTGLMFTTPKLEKMIYELTKVSKNVEESKEKLHNLIQEANKTANEQKELMKRIEKDSELVQDLRRLDSLSKQGSKEWFEEFRMFWNKVGQKIKEGKI